jgi:hypothetical protein
MVRPALDANLISKTHAIIPFSILKLICAASASKSAIVTGQNLSLKKLRIYILKLNETKMFSKSYRNK